MNRITFGAVLALTLMCAAAPAAAQDRTHLQMAAELRILQEQQAQLALSIAQLTQALTDSMKALNGRLDQANQNLIKSSADQMQVVKQMADDVRVVREGTQATGTQLGRLREEIEALRTSLPAMLSRMQPVAPVTEPPLDPNAPAAPVSQLPVSLPPDPAAAAPPLTVGLSPAQLYNTAQSDYAAGQFSLAISGFQQYIRAFPDTDRADDAQQGIGDAENALMRYEDAINAYNRVIQNYPKGDQVPWAYYKRGLVQRRLARTEEARASLEMAVKTATGTGGVADLAKQQLDGLTRAPAAAPAPQRP
jgi:TolA-binding protein